MSHAAPARADFDVVVIGGGPAGATVAADLARSGARTLLIDAGGRIKPCGGAIPTRLISDFAIPDKMLKARIRSARVVAPSGRHVDMPIVGGFVGMVDRETFDPWLREEAGRVGAVVETGIYERASDEDGLVHIDWTQADGTVRTTTARLLVGADGANSAVRRDRFAGHAKPPYVFAYHEIVVAPKSQPDFDADRCDVVFQGRVSPDFYGWVFPHGETVSVGMGSAVKGLDMRAATQALRHDAGLGKAPTRRREGAPLPLKPMKRWDDGRSTVLIGDAAGAVAPSSGEGIYYAMRSGRIAAEVLAGVLESGDTRQLAQVRKRFLAEHGMVFRVLGFMQDFWYRSDKRRERFVAICAHRDVQRLMWESYLTKSLVIRNPFAHLRVFGHNMRHLFGLVFH